MLQIVQTLAEAAKFIKGEVLSSSEQETLRDNLGVANAAVIVNPAITTTSDADFNAITTADKELGALISVADTNYTYVYKLVAGTLAFNDAPLNIKPDDYAASTNERYWKLTGNYCQNLNAEGTSQFIGAVTFNAGTTFVGDLDTTSGILYGGSLDIAGVSYFNDETYHEALVEFNDESYFNGLTEFNDNTTFSAGGITFTSNTFSFNASAEANLKTAANIADNIKTVLLTAGTEDFDADSQSGGIWVATGNHTIHLHDSVSVGANLVVHADGNTVTIDLDDATEILNGTVNGTDSITGTKTIVKIAAGKFITY